MRTTFALAEDLDVAARQFVRKLHQVSDHRGARWHIVHEMGMDAATVWKAVERGWVVLQAVDGNPFKRTAALTEQGRRLAATAASA